jgi:ABC-type antimicrobial peptide transport system permease subunit
MTLLIAFAGLALFLASIGLYGVLSYLVAQRTREIGVRIALGASRASVVRSVIGRGAALTGVGLVIGLVGAWAITRMMQGFFIACLRAIPRRSRQSARLLVAIALIACWLPARRAASVDPLVALRAE